MNKKAFKLLVTISPERLRQSQYVDFIDKQEKDLDTFTAGKGRDLINPDWTQGLSDLKKSHKIHKGSLFYTAGHELSDGITAAEEGRDLRVGSINKTYEAKKADPDKSAAVAAALKNFARMGKPFVGLARWAVGEESVGIRAYIKSSRSEEFAPSVQTLEMNGLFDALERAEEEYDRLYELRRSDLDAQGQENPKSAALRMESSGQYDLLMEYLRYMANKHPDTAWAELFHTINNTREEYASKLAAKGAAAEQRKTNKEPKPVEN